MTSKPTQETALTCKNCSKDFVVIAQEAAFYANKKLPLPDHCPACRHAQRMALRSERKLYRRACDKCKKSILSVYPEDAPYVVYCPTCFWENIE